MKAAVCIRYRRLESRTLHRQNDVTRSTGRTPCRTRPQRTHFMDGAWRRWRDGDGSECRLVEAGSDVTHVKTGDHVSLSVDLLASASTESVVVPLWRSQQVGPAKACVRDGKGAIGVTLRIARLFAKDAGQKSARED